MQLLLTFSFNLSHFPGNYLSKIGSSSIKIVFRSLQIGNLSRSVTDCWGNIHFNDSSGLAWMSQFPKMSCFFRNKIVLFASSCICSILYIHHGKPLAVNLFSSQKMFSILQQASRFEVVHSFVRSTWRRINWKRKNVNERKVSEDNLGAINANCFFYFFTAITSLQAVSFNWSTQPTHSHAGSDHCFHTCSPSILPTFQNLAKLNKFQAKTMFTTCETVGLAEWIIDDTCLVLLLLQVFFVHLGLAHSS